MSKVKTSVLFKQYNQQQNFLLPPSLDELIDQRHLVRIVNDVVEAMNITALINQYEGGGTTAYHPRMLSFKQMLVIFATAGVPGK